MATQEKLNKQGVDYIAACRNTARAAWVSACKHDGIDPNSSFVVFSDDNPFVPFHQQAMKEMFEARQQFADGGYVGLQIRDGRGR